MRHLITLLLAAMVVSSTALAQDAVERIAGPLEMFFPQLETYRALDVDDRTHFRPAYILTSDQSVPPSEISLWYDLDGAERQTLALNEFGQIMNLPSADELSASPDVWINQPSGSMSLTLQFEVDLPLAQNYSKADLEAALEQVNAAVRSAAGMAAMLTPRLRTISFEFDGPGPQAWIIDQDGNRSALSADGSQIQWQPGHRRARGAVAIEFEHAPVRVVLDR